MRPIISIVGKSEAGKTTLLEGLIIELKQRGHKVAVIKHAGEDLELDQVGKDSWRLSQVGSEVMAISSPDKLVIIKQVERDLSLPELSCFITGDFDLILTEGFKQSNTPKIEVHRKEQGNELLCPPQQLLAVVTDELLDIDAPQFAKNEIQALADLIESKQLAQSGEDRIDLFVNDTPVPVNPFLSNFLAKTLLGMVSTLKGIKEVTNLHISLRRKS
ncbi:molybdopterin-guanine dinucleotide biosynthesis protein B [Chloroflexota bacterium]